MNCLQSIQVDSQHSKSNLFIETSSHSTRQASIMKHLKLISLSALMIILTGCANMERVREVNSGAGRLMIGTPIEQVVGVMGEPEAIDTFQNNVLFKYCGTSSDSSMGDPMVYVWMQNGYVKDVHQEFNRKTGYCHTFFRDINWRETLAETNVILIGQAPESYSDYKARKAYNNKVLSDTLQNINQQNNQIYNNLLNNMGTQQQLLQPQRLQTNCMWIGNMLSCN